MEGGTRRGLRWPAWALHPLPSSVSPGVPAQPILRLISSLVEVQAPRRKQLLWLRAQWPWDFGQHAQLATPPFPAWSDGHAHQAVLG